LPLPAPTGRGPVAVVVGGEFGDVRLMTLDVRGRTLAYGRGGGRAGLVSFCPGRRNLVELAYNGTRTVAVVRNARTLRTMRRQVVSLPGQRYAQRLACLDPGGASAVVFARGPFGDSPARSALYRLRPGRLSSIWKGAAFDAAFMTTGAYLSAGARGKTLVHVDLSTGRSRSVATLPGPMTTLAADRTGTLVAGVQAHTNRAATVARVDLRRGRARVSSTRLAADEGQAQLFWLANGRLLFVPTYGTTARVLDDSLRTRSQFRWRARATAVAGRALFGTDLSLSLYRAALPSGPQRVARRLPGRAHFIVAATG
jgi:hypothetical protein